MSKKIKEIPVSVLASGILLTALLVAACLTKPFITIVLLLILATIASIVRIMTYIVKGE